MIKFRAWNGYRKIMADYVSAIQNGDTQGTPSSVNVIVNGKNETWDIKNDHVELLQFTGLKDVNGKEIYEGDIVEVTIEGYVKAYKYLVKNVWDPHVWAEDYYAVSKMEVVGNVHENPELLEVEK
ncbi:YopX protein [Lactiplantibacillus plantarum]|uniref:YopX family protein n=1 Tax=Lactiplantibacillus plantarum TaxID=1590 RepID=UPI000D0C4D53|nr:YopX family protein [Lactiplantibacillus plantarum]SPE08075.1 YopX protein [Lactiplantibacillus plantarum]SPE12085.1 YopX protein [Lactiplantibacillus plantarum]SPH06816.1 YopX protein [Lactiplantibacillus plantarum]SPH09964.1 YopX protein [Lactiplantibacillus plantarum]